MGRKQPHVFLRSELPQLVRRQATRSPCHSHSARQMINLLPPKGTRDFFPDEMRKRNFLFDSFKKTSKHFGFEQWDSPVLESEDLFIRKAGDEITQQLYCFEDKGGRRVTLRPELTPSLARMVMSRGKSTHFPLSGLQSVNVGDMSV